MIKLDDQILLVINNQKSIGMGLYEPCPLHLVEGYSLSRKKKLHFFILFSLLIRIGAMIGASWFHYVIELTSGKEFWKT